jgi:hypothetical protein
MGKGFPEPAESYRNQDLRPIPTCSTSILKLFKKVACQRFVAFPGCEMFKQRGRCRWLVPSDILGIGLGSRRGPA